MKKNNLYITISLLSIAVIGAIVLFKRKKAKSNGSSSSQSTDNTTDNTTSTTVDGIDTTPTPSDYSDYIVTTVSTSLNVRDKASDRGKLIGSLVKGSTVKAKPSENSNWLAVSLDGVKLYGYSNKMYLKKA